MKPRHILFTLLLVIIVAGPSLMAAPPQVAAAASTPTPAGSLPPQDLELQRCSLPVGHHRPVPAAISPHDLTAVGHTGGRTQPGIVPLSNAAQTRYGDQYRDQGQEPRSRHV